MRQKAGRGSELRWVWGCQYNGSVSWGEAADGCGVFMVSVNVTRRTLHILLANKGELARWNGWMLFLLIDFVLGGWL